VTVAHGERRTPRNALTALVLLGMFGGMLGLAFASVPLYRIFRQATGYGGVTRTASRAPDKVGSRVITVRFNTDVDPAVPWRFLPVRRAVQVRVGEKKRALFRVENRSRRTITGTATFNVTPAKAGKYFNKTACFCFTRQTLGAGESADMPVTFFVDPDIVKDRNLDDVDTITLSYTFFRAKTAGDRADRTALVTGRDPVKGQRGLKR